MLEINLHPTSKRQQAQIAADERFEQRRSDRHKPTLRDYLGFATAASLLAAVSIGDAPGVQHTVPPLGGAMLGALTGELLDRTPYLGDAIAQGASYLGDAQPLLDNLDKPGAAIGLALGALYTTGRVWRASQR